jgi:aryl-alcohol dehydrogenase-like predicted oxidoreductase
VTMQQRRLGTTGVWVSQLCLGTMMFGEWGTKDHDQSIRIIHRALDAGITFVDTADVYSAGESEVIVGKALAGRRDDIVLATKAFMPMSDNLNHRGSSRRWIVREVEDSLRRLGTDWIDLYQIHRWDPETDLDETLGALSDLVHQGKIRYFGHSTFPASAIVEAQWTAQRRNRERFVTEQPTYSILTRGIENDVLPTCQRYGMGVLSYSPLAGGWLSGRYRQDATQGPVSVARQRLANRFDLDLPENQRKLQAAAPGPWNTSNHSSPLPVFASPTTSSTASTRSSPPASPSTPPTTAGSAPPSTRPPAAADSQGSTISRCKVPGP